VDTGGATFGEGRGVAINGDTISATTPIVYRFPVSDFVAATNPNNPIGSSGNIGTSPHRLSQYSFENSATDNKIATITSTLPSTFTDSTVGTLRFHAYGNLSNAGQAEFNISTACVGNNQDPINPPYNPAQTVAITFDTATPSLTRLSSLTPLTFTGCAANEVIHIRFTRPSTDAYAGAVIVWGVSLELL
jgi:hypothetical protein